MSEEHETFGERLRFLNHYLGTPMSRKYIEREKELKALIEKWERLGVDSVEYLDCAEELKEIIE